MLNQLNLYLNMKAVNIYGVIYGKFKVQKVKKYSLFHSSPKRLTDFKYSMIERFEGVINNYFLIAVFDEYGVNGQFGSLNDKEQEILPMIYHSADNVLEQYKKLVQVIKH